MDVLEHTRALREERMNLFDQSKEILDRAVNEKRVKTAEEGEQLARIDARIAEIEAMVTDADDSERRARESAVAREAFERQHGGSGGEDRGRRRKADEDFRSWVLGRERRQEGDDPGKNAISIPISRIFEEREAIRQGASAQEIAELRTLLWDTGSSASLVPTKLANSLYEYMEASISALRMPTTKIITSSGEPMQFPRLAAHAIATQVIAQGTAIGGTDPTFAKMTLDAYKYGELVQVSSETLQDAVVNMESFLGRDMGRAVGRVVDADLIAGTGTGEPNGMMTAAVGSVSTGGSLIDPTVEKLIDLQYSVVDEYRNSGSAVWLMNDLTAGVIRKFRDGGGGTVGAFLWEPSLTRGIQGGQPDRLLGYPVYTDPNVASLASNARALLFGDVSAYYIREVGNVVVERSDDYAFNVDLVTFRVKWRVDGDLIDTNAYKVIVRNV